MRGRRSLVVVSTAAAVVVGTATTADATSGTEIAVWQMNESAGARTMADSSGHGFDGRIGGEVVPGGGAYRFARLRPDTPPTHPQHLVTVPDAPALDPADRDYAVTVRLRTTHNFGNIVQKGQATVAGGNWKLQIPSGIVQCLFRGSRGSVIVSAKTRINDGAWHTVRCERTEQGLTLTIDGRVDARRAGRTGTIANSWPVSVGGKTSCDQVDVGCDYYAGDLDYVSIEAR
ncbi:LamG domain-containing protein [Dactylosporangium sucinum]|nr:laminin G domain-containing protein [Dactylosporangium sucinum]